MTKPYLVSVNFNFEGQKNKYLDMMISSGQFRDSREMEAARNKPYDFKCTFPGVKADDILVVNCATGYQVVKAVKVSYPDTIPAIATARIIAKLDLIGIENMELKAQHYEDLLLNIEAEARRVNEKKYYKKLAKQSPHLARLVEMKEMFEES